MVGLRAKRRGALALDLASQNPSTKIQPDFLDRTKMELAHFGRVEIQMFFKKADFFRPVLREFMIAL